jgi:hypothetical protein
VVVATNNTIIPSLRDTKGAAREATMGKRGTKTKTKKGRVIETTVATVTEVISAMSKIQTITIGIIKEGKKMTTACTKKP